MTSKHYQPQNFLVTVSSTAQPDTIQPYLEKALAGFVDGERDRALTVAHVHPHFFGHEDGYHGHVELSHVDAFHLKFGVPMPKVPSFMNEEALTFRLKFLREEVQEFEDAHRAGNMKDAADALVDLVYVALGTALMMGLRSVWWSLWGRVQMKNMLKVRAQSAGESKRGTKLDVVKPAGWTPPDHTPDLGDGPWPTFDPDAATSIDCGVGDATLEVLPQKFEVKASDSEGGESS
jgi:predicted HAD superfamily Cof-like phosphohydrolase